MTTRWWLLKFTPDLRRREPINVGVLLEAGGTHLCQFRDATNGEVNSRAVRRWNDEPANYAAWLRYLRDCFLAQRLDGDTITAQLAARSESDAYAVVPSGEVVHGEDQPPAELLRELFDALVAPVAGRSATSAAGPPFRQQVDQLVRTSRLWEYVGTSFFEDYRISSIEHEELTFPYCWNNGSTTVGALLPKITPARTHGLLWELSTIPHAVNAVVLTGEPAPDNGLGRVLQAKAGHVLVLGETTPDDLFAAFTQH